MLECKYNKESILSYLERYGEIERENRILLEKMSNIMSKTGTQLYNPCKSVKNFKLFFNSNLC